jgi:hypothetical protein
MEDPTYQQQIRINLDEVRRLLWSACCNGHADAALTGSREALSTARAIADLCAGRPGSCGPDDTIRPLQILPREPRRQQHRRGGHR